LNRLPVALDAVVFAAAPEASDEASYEKTYVRALANLLAAVREEHGEALPRIVMLSSTSVYGQTDGEWVEESSATIPTDFRGRLVLRGEETLWSAGLPAIALRLGGLYGPGRESLIDAVRDRRATLDPGPPRYTNRIHREDAAGAITHLIDLPAGAVDRVYVGVDEEPAERNEVLRWLAGRLGVTLQEGAAGSRSERGLSRTETNKRCSGQRLRDSGYRFRYPTFREGYDPLLASR
jgi:nucleoside-diphosphate-sugar epimerase